MTRPINHRRWWTLFFVVMVGIIVCIRWHVHRVGVQINREFSSSVIVEICKQVLIDHIDTETGLRGYLIVGEREYLRPYHEGVVRIGINMRRLGYSIEPDRAEYGHFSQLRAISRSTLAEFANQVAAIDKSGAEPGRERFARFPTKPGMDAIRSHLDEIQSGELRKSEARHATLNHSMATTLWLLDFSTITLTCLLLAMMTGMISPPIGTPDPDPERQSEGDPRWGPLPAD